jgi:hypothetical protein
VPALALPYPQSRFAPPPIADFADAGTRARLSPGALRGFFNVMAKWGVRDEDARALLGGVSNGRYYEWKRDPARRTLDADQLTRISLLVGIYKALHILYGAKLADQWVSLPNRNRIFGGQSALAYMIAGGIAAMQTVRRLLDARRGGA